MGSPGQGGGDHSRLSLLVALISITEWFGLAGITKDHPVQTPCIQQGHLPLAQVAQSPVKPDLEYQ